jgi:hypothetical protein
MLAKGVKISAGTDATRVASYNPWVSLAWLVTGKTVGGLRLYLQHKCLDRETALRMWTDKVTWFSNEQGKKGRLEVGQLADLIVPDRDYFACAEDEIADTTSDLTIVRRQDRLWSRGLRAFRRQGSPARHAGLVAGASLRRLRGLGRSGRRRRARPSAKAGHELRRRPQLRCSRSQPRDRLVDEASDLGPQRLLGRARLLPGRVRDGRRADRRPARDCRRQASREHLRFVFVCNRPRRFSSRPYGA